MTLHTTPAQRAIRRWRQNPNDAYLLVRAVQTAHNEIAHLPIAPCAVEAILRTVMCAEDPIKTMFEIVEG